MIWLIVPGRRVPLELEVAEMLNGLSSKLHSFFQGPAKSPQPPAQSSAPAIPATIQERFTRTRTAEELEGSGFTRVSEEFLKTSPNPAWVALQKGQEFREPATQTVRVGAEVHTDTGYVLKESLDSGSTWMSKVTVQGPGSAESKSVQGSLDLSQLSSHQSMTFHSQGNHGENSQLGRVMTFSKEGVAVGEIESLGRTPTTLHFSSDHSVLLEKNLGRGQENPQSMGRLQSDGSIAFDGSLAHLGVPKTLAIEFPLPLDLTSNMKSG